MNFEKLAEEIGFDKEEYLELIELFISTTMSDIDQLRTGVNKGDFTSAERAAHSIKGAASSLGLSEVSNQAKKIEHAAKEDPGAITAPFLDELESMMNRIRENYKAQKG
ncbi:MAG: Hpt domain-containing protein [Desulfobacteraceae bacterium]|nr:MAG: Hpt domain-containing protein [Desulfobacteraceae bacterium]